MENKAHTEINQEQFKAFAQLPKDTPVVMLNLLKFKDTIVESGISGAEGYKVYMKAALPFFQKANAEVVYMGKPKGTLIGPADEALWDEILLIKYNSITDFLEGDAARAVGELKSWRGVG